MKLRNKKTGKIGYLIAGKGSDHYVVTNDDWDNCGEYHYLTKFNEDWEDYEEPKEIWYIDFQGTVRSASKEENDWFKENEIGNCFETREEAEKAVEKLKAWKRLIDKGFKFEGIKEDYTRILQHPIRTGKRYLQFNKSEDEEWIKENWEDLELLFGDAE